MDCGSGLILLIRQNMLKVPPGGVLEIRSREPTVESELPPWCRMVGHEYLQSIQNGKETWQHWVRRRTETETEQAELEADRKKAQQLAGTDEALDISTNMLCQIAELEDGTKAFAAADATKLQRRLPESVLNEIELFLFGLGEDADLEDAKND